MNGKESGIWRLPPLPRRFLPVELLPAGGPNVIPWPITPRPRVVDELLNAATMAPPYGWPASDRSDPRTMDRTSGDPERVLDDPGGPSGEVGE